MTIIQLTSHLSELYGLGDNGTLYKWNTIMFTWDEVKNTDSEVESDD